MGWIARDIIVASLLAIIIFSGLLVFMSDINLFYGASIDSDYDALYTTINSTLLRSKDTASSIESKVQQSKDLSASETVAFVGDAAVDAIRSLTNLLTLVPIIVSAVSQRIGLPSWFTGPFLGIIGAIIVFVILTLIFRRKA